MSYRASDSLDYKAFRATGREISNFIMVSCVYFIV